MTTTTIISGGLLADGTGGPLREADVAIAAGRVAAIGKDLKGDHVLDAKGAVVAPGFIDIHTHYDAQLFWDPACTSSSWHGVTTVVIGNCGFALAPCRPENRPKIVRMLVELEDMPASVLNAGIDWSFSSFADYLSAVETLRPSLNIAAYVGHSPIRIDVMGEAAYERPATDAEIARMATMVKEGMEAGAVGFATSSGPGGRRSVTALAEEREIMALARAMASSGRGVVALVPGGRSLPRARMYELQPDVGRPFTWTALLAMPDGSHREWAAIHRAHRKWGTQVYPQVSGRPQVAQTTMRTAFALRTPSMLALEGSLEADRRRAYQDPAWRSGNAAELSRIAFPVTWDRWVVAESPRHPELIGANLEHIAAKRGILPVDALFDLALEDDLATRFTVVQFNYQEEDVAALLNTEGTVLGLADSGAHADQLCDAVLPTDLLGTWVREKRVMSLEKAVRKLTGELADLYGFDRGYLRTGAPADVVVFEPDSVAPGPTRRVVDQPAGGERIIADETKGLRHVLVNGTPIRLNGEQLPRGKNGGPGHVLKGH
jgi:N-acyl-D-aspartate/D-glutamate deacylase